MVMNNPNIEHIRMVLNQMSHYRFQCATCLQERLQRKHKSSKPNVDEYQGHPFKQGYIDFYGPFPIQGVGGIFYCLFYITRRGRIGFVHMVKSKSTKTLLMQSKVGG
jgi:hypothetical protein